MDPTHRTDPRTLACSSFFNYEVSNRFDVYLIYLHIPSHSTYKDKVVIITYFKDNETDCSLVHLTVTRLY